MSTVFTQIGNIVGTEITNAKNILTADITNVNTTLTNNISNVNDSLTTNIGNVNTALTADIATAKTALTADIAVVNTALTTDITAVNNSLTSVNTALTTDIANTNTALTADIGTAKAAVETTVSNMVESIAGEIQLKQHMVPVDPTISLGTLEKPFADVFISESSLYVNGTKVLSENSGTIDISADMDQNIRISTQGAGDIEFFPSDLGVIQLKGSVSIPSTKILLTSDGQPLNIGQGINVDGDVSGDNITAMNNRLGSLETLTTSNDLNLDTVQEIVTFIKANKADLDTITLDWTALQNVPLTFAPSAHAHNISEVTNLQTELNSKLLATAKAVDSDKLDGLDSTQFLRTTGKAADANLLDGLDSSAFSRTTHTHSYLGLTAKAADSNLLDGLDSTAFSRTTHTHNYLGATSKAVDSDKLDGLDSLAFTKNADLGTYAEFDAALEAAIL